MFMNFYADECLNFACKVKATGGIYIVGNVSNMNSAKLKAHAFQKRFLSSMRPKHPMLHFLKSIPIYLVKNIDIGLLGAAYIASHPKVIS